MSARNRLFTKTFYYQLYVCGKLIEWFDLNLMAQVLEYPVYGWSKLSDHSHNEQ